MRCAGHSLALVEGVDLDVEGRVLAQHLLGVLVRVERVHEHERHVRLVLPVQVLKRREENAMKRRGGEDATKRCDGRETPLNASQEQDATKLDNALETVQKWMRLPLRL